MRKWVLGFLFDDSGREVVLIKKSLDRGPDHIRGRLNGLGGNVVEGESSDEAMAREGREEAGVEPEWQFMFNYLVYHGAGVIGTVTVYRARDTDQFIAASTMEDEEVSKFEVDDPDDALILRKHGVKNIPWMIALCRDMDLISGFTVPGR